MSLAGGVLATHPVVTAIPFFVPTFIVVAVIGFVIWRDRRRGGGDPADARPEDRPDDPRGGRPGEP